MRMTIIFYTCKLPKRIVHVLHCTFFYNDQLQREKYYQLFIITMLNYVYSFSWTIWKYGFTLAFFAYWRMRDRKKPSSNRKLLQHYFLLKEKVIKAPLAFKHSSVIILATATATVTTNWVDSFLFTVTHCSISYKTANIQTTSNTSLDDDQSQRDFCRNYFHGGMDLWKVWKQGSNENKDYVQKDGGKEI